MMTSNVKIAIAVTFALFITACGGGSAIRSDESGSADTSVGTTASDEQATGSDTQVAMAGQPDKTRVYFEFDSSAIDSESRGIIERHAAYLSANPDVKINLTGHADERGTREYNLALGERRGDSVERMLSVLGVSTDRITTISYGEEQPLAMGHDETSWRVNRRVEFIYQN
ncbi:MAG: peptidoglycan-associated lipoprotein Pal [Acidiferrobacterales bacterium]|nr:peptidoglycan-associated lipoprotein Pal [Acidiferrobacterales bacterium]